MPIHPHPAAPVRQTEENQQGVRIKVIGVGGGGSNAIDRMIASGMEGVEFIAVNTDIQALQVSKAPIRRQIGSRLTNGLSAGSDPDVGRRAAIQDADVLVEALEGADMVFVTAGLGGGTGTGAAPVIAAIASEMGALTVAIVTRPFGFEGKRRMAIADWGIHHLLNYVDTLIVIPNEKLLSIAKDAPFFESFKIADDFLRQAVQGISDIITTPGVINRDFADVKTTMAGMGYGVMGTASRSGPTRAVDAVMAAMASPLLEAGAIDGARGILINITGSSSLRLSEVNDASSVIESVAHEDANIIFGAVLDERLNDEVKVTVIASGFRNDGRNREERRARMLRETGREPVVEHDPPVVMPPVAEEVPEEGPVAGPPAVEPGAVEQPVFEMILTAEPVAEQPAEVLPVVEQPALAIPVVEPSPVVEEPVAERAIEARPEEVPAAEAPEPVAPPALEPDKVAPPAAEIVETPVVEDAVAEPEAVIAEEPVVEQEGVSWNVEREEPDEEAAVENEELSLSFAETYAADEPEEEFHGDEEWKNAIRELARLTEPDLEFDALTVERPAAEVARNPLALRDAGAPVSAPKPAAPPPISNVRQAAFAAYSAVSASAVESKPEPRSPQTSNAFADVLEARRRFVEGMSRSSHEVQALPTPAAPELSAPQPFADLLAEDEPAEIDEEIEQDAEDFLPEEIEAGSYEEIPYEELVDEDSVDIAEPVSGPLAARTYAMQETAPRQPIQEFFDPPLFREPTASNESSPANDLPKPLPDFKRRLYREIDAGSQWEHAEDAHEPQARVPSFAAVPEPEIDADELDELDIPAFLRRGR